MFIISGTRSACNLIGFGSAFCPICRDFRTFEVSQICDEKHIYFISIHTTLLGFQVRCQDCRVLVVCTEQPYHRMDGGDDELDYLIEHCHPILAAVDDARLALETHLKAGKLIADPRVRRALLREPFQYMAAMMDAEGNDSRIDGRVLLAGAVSIALAATVPSILMAQGTPNWLAYGSTCLIGFLYCIYELAGSNRRYLERFYAPRLARALKPLKPTPDELIEILEAFRHQGYRFPRRMRLAALETALYAEAFSEVAPTYH